jgi:hypothetical protein
MTTHGPARPRPVPRPRIALGVLYLLGFFALYCVALVTPALWHVARSLPTGPAQQQVAMEVARDTIRPRLPFAFAAALTTTAWGMYKGFLPGARRPS